MIAALSTTLAAATVAEKAAAQSAPAPAGLMPGQGQYVPVAPVTILDTRNGVGAPVGIVPAGGRVTFNAAGVGALPSSGIDALAINVIVVNTGVAGHVAVQPYDDDRVDDSTVLFSPGGNESNYDVVKLHADGILSAYALGTDANVVVRVHGYYTSEDAALAGATYVPVVPSTLVDTRANGGATLASGATRVVQATGAAGIPASPDVIAVSMNVIAVTPSANGYFTIHPSDVARPWDSSVNYEASVTSSNFETVGLSSTGAFSVYNSGGSAHLVVRPRGYYLRASASQAGSTYRPVPPAGIASTVDGTGGVPVGKVAAGASITFPVAGVAGVPTSGVRSVALSIQAVGSTMPTALRVYPAGSPVPQDSSVNAEGAGDTATYDAVDYARLTSNGSISIRNDLGQTHIMVRVRGYFIEPTAPTAPMHVNAAQSGSSWTVSWEPPLSDGGAAVTQYAVTSIPAGVTATTSGTQTTVTAPTADGYQFKVQATNQVGTGTASVPSVHKVAGQLTGAEAQAVAERYALEHVREQVAPQSLTAVSGGYSTNVYDEQGAIVGSVLVPRQSTGDVQVVTGAITRQYALPNTTTSVDGQLIGADIVMYPNVAPDTDVLAAVTGEATANYTVMRSPSANHQLRQTVPMEPGETLSVNADDNSAAVLNAAGEVISLVAAPWVKNAQGVDVPFTMTSVGNELVMDIPVAAASGYPLVADPYYVHYDYYYHFTTSAENQWCAWPSRWKICLEARTHANKATDSARYYYPTSLHNGRGDSFRHCYWSARMTRNFGATTAKGFGDRHEMGGNVVALEKEMDLRNNAIGRNIGGKSSSYTSALNSCRFYTNHGLTWIIVNGRLV
ncbi:MAG TPA: fibronectin type III domain-containing protein [Mycobacteriales bacterium]|nr:fibronectin type III domain-containing protein [Mycobacteriales bacterium]